MSGIGVEIKPLIFDKETTVYDVIIKRAWHTIMFRCETQKGAQDLKEQIEKNVIGYSVTPERSLNG